ncbi:hypothetical protein NL676_001599 [Syzygium grande]|nr:hypothetical protein NL676_001599 [Syzygium grande]
MKSPSKETLWDSWERKSPPPAVAAAMLFSDKAKLNSEKKGPCKMVLTQCTTHSFDSCTSWYNVPPFSQIGNEDEESKTR